jgi:hypothetical protein
MKFMTLFLMAMLPIASVAQSQPGSVSGVPSIAVPKTIAALVIETPKQGVTPSTNMALMPEEIRPAVQLYLDGKIRQWYSRGDGKGVIFVVDAKTEDQARPFWKLSRSRSSNRWITSTFPSDPMAMRALMA